MPGNKIKVLYLEDSAEDGFLVQRELRNIADVQLAVNDESFKGLLKQQRWDVILLDFSVPHFSGEEAIALVKQFCADVPIVICSGSINDKSASVYLRSGAVDYLLKDRLNRLPEAVRQAHENHMLRRQAMRDNRLELLGGLATGFSHDFNQLLQTFYAGIELLKARVTDEKDQRVLDAMLSAAQRGSEMTKMITSFARGGNGGGLKPVSAEYLMTEIRTTLELTFPKVIQLKFTTAPGTSKAVCDASAIHQVLLNLATNSKDALMPRGGEIHFSAQNADMQTDTLNGKYIMFTVRDNAGGIPEHILAKLFTPFNTSKEKNKGTGLGLSMAKAVITGHGGEIDVKTGTAGTSFFIYLPTGDIDTHAEKVIRLEEFDGLGKQILLVDDEHFMRTLLSMHLTDANYKTLIASSGPEALSFLRTNKNVDLLLTDYGMAYMNGIELIASLRGQGIDIPAILITGHADIENEVFDPRPDAVIRKPFTRSQLLETIRDVFDLAT